MMNTSISSRTSNGPGNEARKRMAHDLALALDHLDKITEEREALQKMPSAYLPNSATLKT